MEREREGDSEKGVEDSSVNKSLELLGEKKHSPWSGRTDAALCLLTQTCVQQGWPGTELPLLPTIPRSRQPGPASDLKASVSKSLTLHTLEFSPLHVWSSCWVFLSFFFFWSKNPSINGLSSYLVTRHLKSRFKCEKKKKKKNAFPKLISCSWKIHAFVDTFAKKKKKGLPCFLYVSWQFQSEMSCKWH